MNREIIKLSKLDYLPIVYPEMLQSEMYCFDFEYKYSDYFDFTNDVYLGGYKLWDDYELVRFDVVDFFHEDVYIVLESIVKRTSDNKYFRGIVKIDHDATVEQCNSSSECILTEVFPITVQRTEFE